MLRVTLHAGGLSTREANNQLASLDIAYRKKGAMSDYLAALSMRQAGELEPATVANYPRWAGSLWDLVARALTRTLYKADQAPAAAKVDRRCAYAVRVCAVIQLITADERGQQLGTVEVAQIGGKRGVYTAKFEEDILGARTVSFEYGCKALNPADLLLRAICWSLFGKDVLGSRPTLIVPAGIQIDGEDRFDFEGLAEPAKTGFGRYQANRLPLAKPEALPLAKDYVQFLMEG